MAINFILDETGQLENYVKEWIRRKKDFRLLGHLNFLYVWKMNEPEIDKEKRFLEASIRRLPSRERDVYGKDVELRVYQEWWNEKTKKQRIQLIFHELLHVSVRVDEAMQPQVDEDGRIKVDVIPHDIVIHGFKREWEEFGIPPEHAVVVKIAEAAERERKDRVRTKSS